MNDTCDNFSFRSCLYHTDTNLGVQCDRFIFISKNCFINALEYLVFALCTRSFLCQIVNTEDHILGRNGYRTTIGRL